MPAPKNGGNMEGNTGNPSATPQAGVLRFEAPTIRNRLTAPTLVMTGAYDNAESRLALYREIGAKQKVFLNIAGASHFIQWEKQRGVLFAASLEWLSTGRLQGKRRGRLSVNEQGQFKLEDAS